VGLGMLVELITLKVYDTVSAYISDDLARVQYESRSLNPLSFGQSGKILGAHGSTGCNK